MIITQSGADPEGGQKDPNTHFWHQIHAFSLILGYFSLSFTNLYAGPPFYKSWILTPVDKLYQ